MAAGMHHAMPPAAATSPLSLSQVLEVSGVAACAALRLAQPVSLACSRVSRSALPPSLVIHSLSLALSLALALALSHSLTLWPSSPLAHASTHFHTLPHTSTRFHTLPHTLAFICSLTVLVFRHIALSSPLPHTR
eukprot:6211258-Pleurochrysis_carterae.AAC.1